jgi:hypothetical protein
MAAEFSSTDLVKALRKQVTVLEGDLRARVDGADVDARQPEVGERWRAEHMAALKAQRTAASWQAWRDERVTQSAVAWVLLTVFARYTEDHALVSKAWIGGPDADSRQQALDARRAYFTTRPEHTDREWLREIITHFANFEATRGLVDTYSPLHQVAPSGDAARAILEFWWDKDASGDPLWSFVGVDTRFLGDVYQDLSEFAKKTYALLQTPEFVEEFILDQTLEPALAERPLEGFTVIDPTCGSGHFLLGAFHRLLERWQREAPALGPRALVSKALKSVYGVDINPFAVAIARFRLMVAALDASGDKSIEKLIDIELNLAAGDSLIWGARQQVISDDLWTFGREQMALATENADSLKSILQREHDVVVGNPPYITVKDRALNATYRSLYSACYKQLALSVPFAQLFFDLAKHGNIRGSGWVGQITANSFMKRDFGEKLIGECFANRDIRMVVDSEGAWIPGHNSDGTPTVILIGTGASLRSDHIRVVMSKGKRESKAVGSSGEGPYWRSLVENAGAVGFSNSWIDVVDLPRSDLARHPWSLTGGGAVQLMDAIAKSSTTLVSDHAVEMGYGAVTREDAVYLVGEGTLRRNRIDVVFQKQLVEGANIRDWLVDRPGVALWPYAESTLKPCADRRVFEFCWPYKQLLSSRVAYGKTQIQRKLEWFEYSMFFKERYRSRYSIAFSFVATHNHFYLNRESNIFKQSSPVLILRDGASEDDYLRLLGVLNSSVVGFWLRENTQPKGGAADVAWLRTREYAGTIVGRVPLPSEYPLGRARSIDLLGKESATYTPAAVGASAVPTAEALVVARQESERVRALMIAHQEELDWECYRLYGLLDEDLTYSGDLPGIALGERAFEIYLADAIGQGGDATWFERHHSTPANEIPMRLPVDYRVLIQRRLDVIASHPDIRLLEKPEHKRRWASESWNNRVTDALRDWLLDRIEDKGLWFEGGHPAPCSVAQLADKLDRDENFRRVLRLWGGGHDVSTVAALGKLLDGEGVPYLAALRYKPSGLEKRAAWVHTWDLQRREDAGETLDGPIPVPPRFVDKDFIDAATWQRRKALDLPKERFVSYPGAGRDNDTSALLGWAGWDHAEQALALAGLVDDRIDKDGWDQSRPDKLVPMLAGLSEIAPWVRQWHGEVDPEFGESVADTIDEVLRSRSAELGVTADQLAAWRPPTTTRVRRTSKKTEGESR